MLARLSGQGARVKIHLFLQAPNSAQGSGYHTTMTSFSMATIDPKWVIHSYTVGILSNEISCRIVSDIIMKNINMWLLLPYIYNSHIYKFH